MRGAERGFLLLCSQLGDPERRVLTVPQIRTLAKRVRENPDGKADRTLELADLKRLGYGVEMAQRILDLLGQEDLLEHYLRQGRRAGCVPVTRVTEGYPLLLRKRLGADSPGCLWAKGDLSMLDQPKIALVGSRDLNPENLHFAAEAGRQAARQGYVLVSGNARGADRTAQNACLQNGGRVISVVADRLDEKRQQENVLYLSEESFDLPFSAQRALSRNRCIHALGEKTFVAQCTLESGGTWDGTVKNLRYGWSPVYVFADGSDASAALDAMGALSVLPPMLEDIGALPNFQNSLFD